MADEERERVEGEIRDAATAICETLDADPKAYAFRLLRHQRAEGRRDGVAVAKKYHAIYLKQADDGTGSIISAWAASGIGAAIQLLADELEGKASEGCEEVK